LADLVRFDEIVGRDDRAELMAGVFEDDAVRAFTSSRPQPVRQHVGADRLRMASWQAAIARDVSSSAKARADRTWRLASLTRSPAAALFALIRSRSRVAIASRSQAVSLLMRAPSGWARAVGS
jgi:hypothetical protein